MPHGVVREKTKNMIGKKGGMSHCDGGLKKRGGGRKDFRAGGLGQEKEGEGEFPVRGRERVFVYRYVDRGNKGEGMRLNLSSKKKREMHDNRHRHYGGRKKKGREIRLTSVIGHEKRIQRQRGKLEILSERKGEKRNDSQTSTKRKALLHSWLQKGKREHQHYDASRKEKKKKRQRVSQ